MATIAELEESGALVKLDLLDPGEMPWRYIYATPAFIQWLDEVLPSLISTTVGSQLSPQEQVFARFDEYVAGEACNDNRRFKSLSATPDHHVWEFKTDDIRVFGWIPRRDTFIATFGDTKDDIETYRRYGLYMARTKFVRDNLGLDEPNCLTEKDYPSVVSDKA